MTDRDKLRERVADVIVKSWDEDEEYNSFKCADAAIAVCMDEVVRLIAASTWLDDDHSVRDTLTAAIRALASGRTAS